MFRQYKARKIGGSSSNTKYGFTLPSRILMFFGSGTNFNLSISGNAIIYTSGASIQPTKEEVVEFQWEED